MFPILLAAIFCRQKGGTSNPVPIGYVGWQLTMSEKMKNHRPNREVTHNDRELQ
jgi:hypothetical protein